LAANTSGRLPINIPAVSNQGMRIIDAKLKKNKKVLLWVVQSKKELT
jgi:hypothetical protein